MPRPDSLPISALSLLLVAALGCSSDDDNDGFIEPPEPDPACPDPTSLLPNPWRMNATVDTGAVVAVSDRVATIDAVAGGSENAREHSFVYVSFTGDAVEKAELSDVDAMRNVRWDIAFKRSLIRSNGGDSGPGGVRIAAVEASSLDEVSELPAASAFLEDDWVTDDCQYNGGMIDEPITAVGTWYDYDFENNLLTPANLVYVLERPDGSAVKFAVRGYYNADKVSGHYEIEWAALQ